MVNEIVQSETEKCDGKVEDEDLVASLIEKLKKLSEAYSDKEGADAFLSISRDQYAEWLWKICAPKEFHPFTY